MIHFMVFKKKLIENLDDKLPKNLEKLIPNGFQRVGNKIIINLSTELEDYFFLIGQKILEMFPAIKSVFVKTGEITGELRTPQVKLIAGLNDSIVENYENGIYYCYDLEKIMFAKGNVNERGRLAKLVNKNEIIVDMFAGIGYFSLPIAKKNPSVTIYAIDLNENAIYWLKKSMEKNKIKNIIPILGNSKDEVKQLVEKNIFVDRVLMGYLPPPKDFIFSALSILKSGGIVHYDALIRTNFVKEDIEEVKKLFENFGKKVEIINSQRVKSYKPKVEHYVLDLKIF